ncbi:MAG: hypothetical protein LW636_04845 [Planctomycetaceae bacterium]|nr:hypothetical protein [Planctomycetaceae bacterium]
MRVRFPSARLLVATAATVGLWVASGCGMSPWEQEGGIGGLYDPELEKEHVFVAESAKIAVWRDERPSGLVINHGLLEIDAPRLESGPKGGRTVLVVTTKGPELYGKVRDVLTDRIPVTAGMDCTFALGRTVPVRIERVEPNGGRTFVEEGRVSFLELVRR